MDAAGLGIVISGAVAVGGFAMYVIRSEMRGDITRLDGRINVNEALQKELKDDVQYIRERIDAALNGHGK